MNNTNNFTIYTCQNRKEKVLKKDEFSWDKFIEHLSQTHRTYETQVEYFKMKKHQQDDIKDVGGFIAGALKDGRRIKSNVINRTMLTLDIDHIYNREQLESLVDIYDMLFTWNAVFYSTHKHKIDSPRLRLVIPLSRTVTPDEYQAVARKVAGHLNIELFDDSTFEPSRLMYWPSTSKDAEYYFKVIEGEFLDPDSILEEYTDWKDTTSWPISKRQNKVIQRGIKKQEDPLSKGSIVGTFCRAYSVSAAIEEYLSDVYEVSIMEGRYNYIAADSSSGLVVYEDKFAYSHHATDPACNLLCNAFDLVRIHKFGHLDDEQEDKPMNKRLSYLSMVDLAESDTNVMKLRNDEKMQQLKDDFKEEVNPRKLFFENKKFVPKYLADWFMFNHRCILVNETLYIYDGGRYVYGELIFQRKAAEALDIEYQSHRVNEALSLVKLRVEIVPADIAASTGPYLNLKNGLLHLGTFEFTPHTPELKTIIQLPVKYNPTAVCPKIDQYLNHVSKDSIPVIEEMLGYCLIPSMKYEASFLLFGDGGNGKGTLIKLISELLGDENKSNLALQTLAENRFAASELFGKMVNVYADIPSKTLLDSSIFKITSSGDAMMADRKHLKPINFCNRAKHIFSGNELPVSRDNSDGYHRRWIIIPFNIKFEDTELREELFKKSEMEGLLNKALTGLKRLEAQKGFTRVVSVVSMCEEYRGKSDSAYMFLNEYCKLDETNMVSKQGLYNAYKRTCIEWGRNPISQANFNAKVKKLFPGVVEYRAKAPRRWKGLYLEKDLDEDFLNGPNYKVGTTE